jgi:NADPH:quinone reductase-like Zn-dependent oxidoreductase
MGIFKQEHVIAMPSNLSFDEAATLPCSALTAWNALHGIAPLKAGECVLVQGTGGVSLFAALFALAAGAIVIATTSTEEKATRLRKLSVHHVLNYKENPEWGTKAKGLSPSGQGCHRVIEVGGQQTIAQSFQCVARGGEIDIIGFLTGQRKDDAGLTYLEPLIRACTVRGIEVGNRVQFEEMVRAIERPDIRPVIDGKRFALAELQEAYQFMWSQSQIGKIVLTTSNSA